MLVSDDYNKNQDETHILHPSSRKLFRFWEAMRAERAAPRRDQLDLKHIRPLVPQLFITEFSPRTETFRWRLAGTALCELYRYELTGTNMLAGWDSFETDTISRFLKGTTQNLQPCLLRFRFHTDHDQMIGAELAGFPMTAADGRSTHIFGGLFSFSEIWSMEYTALTHFELSAARSIWTEPFPAEGSAPAGATHVNRNFRVISGGMS